MNINIGAVVMTPGGKRLNYEKLIYKNGYVLVKSFLRVSFLGCLRTKRRGGLTASDDVVRRRKSPVYISVQYSRKGRIEDRICAETRQLKIKCNI
ncbi:hypothetical protein A359_04560 [secondary endosymbiont of Ctenarytaina eucalypti]|uniref:Uncharacterized protein n=1 Tax=secondary endosymbiont of Ctenarytaina eucalypti TaxID=1199245 RepID=J3Z3N5_9ENTR|nr:hypothetical protein A359_04560 [secondary endosymbiont of Ctenarytaina eucalypti]